MLMSSSLLFRFFQGFLAALLSLALFSSALVQAAGARSAKADKTISIVIIPGDTGTVTAVNAVRELRKEKEAKNVRFRIVSTSQLSDADLDALATSSVALVYNMSRELAKTIAPALSRLKSRGAKAYAIGSPFEEGRDAGLTQDETLRAYSQSGGVENYEAMLRMVLSRDFGFALKVEALRPFPAIGLWNPRNGKVFSTFDDYAADYLAARPDADGRVWVGVAFNRVTAQAGRSQLLLAIVEALEKRGFNVAPAFGFPPEVPLEKLLIDAAGKARVEALVGLSLKIGVVAEKTIPVMNRLDVPVINAIPLSKSSREEWEASPLGLTQTERPWQVSTAEFGGFIAPTVVSAKERLVDRETGLEYVTDVPIPERIERLADRVKKLVTLRHELNANKRVAVIYYNYPPGKENIGASYLNVMPRSLWQILGRMTRDGYSTQGAPASEEALFETLREHGTNVSVGAPGALEKMVRGGQVMLLPVADYRRWFDQLPRKLRDDMLKSWGEPEKSTVMLWRDGRGRPHFVFPVQRFGNVVFAPQPARGWGADIKKMYHDLTLPPHHQYLAFYLWLQKGYKAHAMVHVGTHATHEWLSGKEIGFTDADPGEAMVADVPQLYPYIVDDIGEGLQAKRRGMATLISHMTPPFARASLNTELLLLKGLVDDYVVAAQKSGAAAAIKLGEINRQAGRLGVLKDLGKPVLNDGEDVEGLEHYLKEIGEKQSPYGLHTFGVAPPEALRQSTAEAMLSLSGALVAEEYERRKSAYAELIETSAKNELDALMHGLSGRYVSAGPGNDPIRNPASLPTGRNLYGFDPSRLPSPGTWEKGRQLAEQFVADYRQRHGQYPDRVVFNLWSIEAMRHEGVTEAEILALMGVRPKWDERGRVDGVEIIPRAELKRPRVDVTIVPSGLYRDALPVVMQLLDQAVSKVKDLPEEDNAIRANVQKTRRLLEERGVDPKDAERMAAVRLFTEPPGAYGTGIENVVQASNTWQGESEVADVYFNRVGHLFGQGYWGGRPGGKDLAVDIFKMALKDAKAAIHSRSSNLYATLDNDDVYQYLGATAMAIRQVNGKTPETMILNLADASGGKHETLDKFMGREMRTRYTNPEWVKAMLKEGYAGARTVMHVTENLWGWQVTVPEAVDGAKWNEMYETYVKDRNALGVKQMFRDAKNLLAYQAMVDKMLVAVNKGYWKADPEVKAHLEQVNRDVIAEAGVACDETSCSSQEISAQAKALDRQAMAEARAMPAPNAGRQSALSPANAVGAASAAAAVPAASRGAPAMTPPPAPGRARGESGSAASVEGFEVKEQPAMSAGLTPAMRNWALAGFSVLVALGFGINAWRRKQRG